MGSDLGRAERAVHAPRRCAPRRSSDRGAARRGGRARGTRSTSRRSPPDANQTGEPRPSPHTWEAHPHVPPGGILMLTCEIPEDEPQSEARTSIYIDFQASGLVHVGLLGVTIELLNHGTADGPSVAWKVGRVRPGLLA